MNVMHDSVFKVLLHRTFSRQQLFDAKNVWNKSAVEAYKSVRAYMYINPIMLLVQHVRFTGVDVSGIVNFQRHIYMYTYIAAYTRGIYVY